MFSIEAQTLTHVAPLSAMSSVVSANQEIAKATSNIMLATKSSLPHLQRQHSPSPGDNLDQRCPRLVQNLLWNPQVTLQGVGWGIYQMKTMFTFRLRQHQPFSLSSR